MSLSSLLSALRGGASADAIDHEALERACLAGTHCLVDVREPHEFAVGHLPGAVNHPLSTFDPANLPAGKPVVLVCQAGSRSAKALQMAKSAGRADAVHYAPGTAGWRARGGRIEM